MLNNTAINHSSTVQTTPVKGFAVGVNWGAKMSPAAAKVLGEAMTSPPVPTDSVCLNGKAYTASGGAGTGWYPGSGISILA